MPRVFETKPPRLLTKSPLHETRCRDPSRLERIGGLGKLHPGPAQVAVDEPLQRDLAGGPWMRGAERGASRDSRSRHPRPVRCPGTAERPPCLPECVRAARRRRLAGGLFERREALGEGARHLALVRIGMSSLTGISGYETRIGATGT